MGKYFCFYVVVHALVYLLELGNPGVLIEEIRNVQYVIGLFLLYVGYAIILWFLDGGGDRDGKMGNVIWVFFNVFILIILVCELGFWKFVDKIFDIIFESTQVENNINLNIRNMITFCNNPYIYFLSSHPCCPYINSTSATPFFYSNLPFTSIIYHAKTSI